MAGSYLQAIGQTFNKKGGWTNPSELTGNKRKQDNEIRRRLRKVKTFVLWKHYDLLSRPYVITKEMRKAGDKSKSRVASVLGEYPKKRTGNLQSFIKGIELLPKKGSPSRGIRFEYFPEVEYYAKILFSEQQHKRSRKGIYEVILEFRKEIQEIMKTRSKIEAIRI